MIDFAEAMDAWSTADTSGLMVQGEPAPETWEEWVRALFPQYVEFEMSERHVEFWEHVWSIEPEAAPLPFVAVWPRGGG